MSFIFYTPINDAGAVLAAPHTAGDGHLVLDDASLFAAASPSPTAPIRVCAGSAIFKVVGISGSTLSLDGTIEGTTDISLPSGTAVEDRVTAADITDLQQAIITSSVTIGNIADELDLKAPAISPVLTNVVTQNTTVDHGFVRILHNTGTVLPTNISFGDSYEGYNFAGTIDNAYMRGYLQYLQADGYPAFWEQWENWWSTNNALEYHWNYISIDKTVTYRPWGSALYLDTHTLDYFMQYLGTWILRGIGSGYGDTNPPLLQWDGNTGNLAVSGGINASLFSGSGSGLTSLPAENLTGTIADARFPSHLLVDSNNDSLGVHVTDMNDMVTGLNWFKVGGNNTGQSFGYQGAWISFVDGTHKCLWTPQAIGSFSNEPFSIITNSVAAATFGTDGSLTTTGPITTPNLTVSGASFRVNTAGTYPLTFGAQISDSYPCIWATSATPTLSNYLMLVDGPGGGVVLKQTNFAILQAGSNQLQLTPTGTGFFGATPVTQRSGDITTGLVALGLFSSATVASATTISGSITESQVTNLVTDLAAKAPIASPTFTGVVIAPTIGGSVASAGNLTLQSTSHATKGLIKLGIASAYDEVNSRLGIGTASPLGDLHVSSTGGQFIISDSDTSVDYKHWSMIVSDGTLNFRLLNDAVNVATNWMTVNRSGTTVNQVLFPNGKVGVGATTPGAQLQVNADAATTKGLIVKGGTTARTITNVALTSNVVTITTSVAHGFIVGQTGVNTGLTTSLNDSYVIASVPTTTTFTYAKTAANITSVADSGTATANQIANLLEVQNPAGTALMSILSNGRVDIGPTSILPDGRLGVGTSQPDRLLHVNGTFHQYIHFSTTSGVDYDIAMQFSDTTYTIYEGLLGNAAGTSVGGTAGTWGVFVNAGVRLAIPQTGFVGIGTLAPNAQLQVSTGAATTIGLIVKGFASQSANLQEWQSSTGTVLSCVDASGKVAIGALSTSYPLTVKSGTAGFAFDAANQVFGTTFGTSGSFEIRAEDPTSTNGGSVFFGGSTRGDNRKSAIVFSVNGVEHFRLDGDASGHTAGNFGFGTATPLAKIQINTPNATSKGLIIKGFSSQSVNLFEAQDTSGTALVSIACTGETSIRGLATSINATAKTTAYTIISASDSTILGNASGGDFAITLPAANTVLAGRTFVVKSVSTGTVTLTAAGSDVIDGAGTYPLATQYKYVTVQSDGVSKWYVIGNN